ncbi:hypothetical protein ACFC3Z_12255 [Enterococcus thailandicus]|uniref:hypothetical protein n=1 Tax=Enterococcus thailandicus TaxID=417368 RepID=UPI0035E39F22
MELVTCILGVPLIIWLFSLVFSSIHSLSVDSIKDENQRPQIDLDRKLSHDKNLDCDRKEQKFYGHWTKKYKL